MCPATSFSRVITCQVVEIRVVLFAKDHLMVHLGQEVAVALLLHQVVRVEIREDKILSLQVD